MYIFILQDMQCSIFIAIILLMKLVSGNEANSDTSQVVKLDGDTFQAELPESHHFVMFFAPWLVLSCTQND